MTFYPLSQDEHILLSRSGQLGPFLCKLKTFERRVTYEVSEYTLKDPTCSICIARWAILTANFGTYKFYASKTLRRMLEIIRANDESAKTSV